MTVRVGVVAQRDNERAAALADDVRTSVGADVVVDEETGEALSVEGVPVSAMAARDLVVSIGGDGTFLFASRAADGTPVMGVNLGEVGFLNAVAPDEAVEVVREEVTRIREEGSPRLREVPQVRASGSGWRLPPALNEVAVLGPQRGRGNGIEFEVRIDGSFYGATDADGVLVATPTGSTAYNLSEGGPLVHPDVDALVVTEMVAREPMPPLVVSGDSEVTVRAESPERAFVVADGRTTESVRLPATVTVRRAETPVRVAGPPLDFFAALGKLD
jgi:NAD+ kinase